VSKNDSKQILTSRTGSDFDLAGLVIFLRGSLAWACLGETIIYTVFLIVEGKGSFGYRWREWYNTVLMTHFLPFSPVMVKCGTPLTVPFLARTRASCSSSCPTPSSRIRWASCLSSPAAAAAAMSTSNELINLAWRWEKGMSMELHT